LAHVPTDPAILIVENDEETRELYTDALSPINAVLLEAGNPYEAFEQLEKRSFSLIVTDLHMPGGGIEFLANLRGADVFCPIIVITGLGGDSVRNAAMVAGATVFLEKPIRTKQLREIVNRFLSSTPTIA
jgi:CheY-like chemotaxis protein